MCDHSLTFIVSISFTRVIHTEKLRDSGNPPSLRSEDVFLVVASLPPKTIFGGREATTGNTSALRRLKSTR